MNSLPQHADAVVIGGGAIGCSITYHLARLGLKVTLLEKRYIGAGTSTATFAWVGAHAKSPWVYNLFSQEAVDCWAQTSEELETDVEFTRRGSLILLSKADFEQRQTQLPGLQKEGYNIRLVDKQELIEMEPWAGKPVGQEVEGALFCPTDAEINPLRMLQAFTKRARELGAVIHRNTAAEGLITKNGRVQGVNTNLGNIQAPIVVNAAGAYAGEIGRMAGLEIPMKVARGQVLVTEKRPPMMNYIHSGLRQAKSGNFIIGFTNEDVGFDTGVTYEGIEAIVRRVTGKMPFVTNIPIIRAYAGLRPLPNDDHPIIDKIEKLEGFYVAVMHSGITLSAYVGRLIGEWVDSGTRPDPLKSWCLSRFDRGEDKP